MPRTSTPRATPWLRAQYQLGRFPAPEPDLAVDEDTPWVADQPGVAFDAALLALGMARRPPGLRDGAALAARLARRPQRVARPLATLAADGVRIARGTSELEPWRKDRRYADSAWKGNPLFRGLAQGHAAVGAALESLVEAAGLDPAGEYRIRLGLDNAHAALAPANFPLTNPGAWKAAIDTGGGSLARGLRRLAEDMREPPRLPARSDPSDLRLGVELAATPGAIVMRTPAMELIQYEASTPEVHAEPLLIVPSLVNKYYLTDLSPGRSLVEHLVAAGFEVFQMSWLNPTAAQRGFDLDTYIAAILDALGAVETITGTARTHALGVCAGGQLLSIAAAHLAATGAQERLASITLPVAVLDHSEPASPTGLVSRESAERAMKRIERKGIVDGRELSSSLAWLRPIDSIWWAWVERYLLAADIPKLDLFHWSEDTTNLPAAMVRDMLELTLGNLLTRPGALTVLAAPVDLRRVRTDAYLIAGFTDNLTPWRSCYRTCAMLGSRCRFVLVRGGHLQAILRPPGGRAGGFRTRAGTPRDADEWLAGGTDHDGSWWTHWERWLARRSTGTRPAPSELGAPGLEPLERAPGRYARKRLGG
jgi:polyhydroxyalkanoate synthase